MWNLSADTEKYYSKLVHMAMYLVRPWTKNVHSISLLWVTTCLQRPPTPLVALYMLHYISQFAFHKGWWTLRDVSPLMLNTWLFETSPTFAIHSTALIRQLNTKSRHDANFFIADGNGGCCYDNLGPVSMWMYGDSHYKDKTKLSSW